MSKYVKNLISGTLRNRLQEVQEALLVNVIGLNANATSRLRAELQSKNIHLLVVKNSLAARATEGTPLAAMFEGLAGTAAVCWGAEDIVTLAKEVSRLAGDEKFAPFVARGGVLEGQRLDQRQVADVAKWPSRTEQLSLLVGQVLSPGANLVSQLISAGGALASQIKQKGEGEEEEEKGEESSPDSTSPTPEAQAAASTPEAAGG